MEKQNKKLVAKALVRYFMLTSLTAIVMFASAGSFLWAGAWTIIWFSLLYLVVIATIGLRYFPETVLGRAQTKFVHGWDKAAIVVYMVGFISQYIIAGFDFRYSWSSFPSAFFMIGFALYSCGMIINFFVLATNPYAIGSSRYQKDRKQKVISSGPYRFVRHPMYSTVIFFASSIPLILDSAWAFTVSPVIIASFIFRCYKEDNMLQKELKGYKTYCQKVKYRMIPFVW